MQGAAQAEYAWSQGYKNAYLLRSPDIEYTQMPLYFAEAFKKLGGAVVGESIYALSQPDFSAEVTKIKQLSPQPDVIVTSAFEPDFPAFIRQLRGAGVKIPVVRGDGIDLADHLRARRRGGGVVFTSSGFAAPGSPMEAYQKKYQAKFGKAPESIMDALGYDLAKIIEAAVIKADSVEPAKREALASLRTSRARLRSSATRAATARRPGRSTCCASKAASACWSAPTRPTPRSCPSPSST